MKDSTTRITQVVKNITSRTAVFTMAEAEDAKIRYLREYKNFGSSKISPLSIAKMLLENIEWHKETPFTYHYNYTDLTIHYTQEYISD